MRQAIEAAAVMPKRQRPNHALQRTRPWRRGWQSWRLLGRVAELGSLAGTSMFGILRRFRKSVPQNVWAASIYLRGGDLIIHAQNRTYNNVGWNSDPALAMKADASAEEVGRTVRSVLRASRWDAAAPDSDGAENPVLKAAGVSSWRDLEQGSRLVTVALEKGRISIYPYRPARRSEGKGFVQMDDAPPLSVPNDAGDSDLGAAVIEGLKRSIPSPLAR